VQYIRTEASAAKIHKCFCKLHRADRKNDIKEQHTYKHLLTSHSVIQAYYNFILLELHITTYMLRNKHYSITNKSSQHLRVTEIQVQLH